MNKFIIAPMLTLLMYTDAFAIEPVVDFTKAVEGNAMLVILFLVSALASGFFYSNSQIKNLDKKLEQEKEKAEAKQEEIEKADLKLQEHELVTLKLAQTALAERVAKVENEQGVCQRTMPTTYVTKSEFDKFQAQHREDINSIAVRMETMIKDFRNELKSDMQDQIDRIINVINEVIKK